MRPSYETTIYDLLCDGARQWPDRILIRLESGEAWTWAQSLTEGARAANSLANRGVRRDDGVLVALPNGASWLRAWWGTTLSGAVFVPVNPNLRGRSLADVCDLVSPSIIVAGDEVAALLAPHHRERVMSPMELTIGGDEIVGLDPVPAPWDIHCLLLTSGTTEPSKASTTTHAEPLGDALAAVLACALSGIGSARSSIAMLYGYIQYEPELVGIAVPVSRRGNPNAATGRTGVGAEAPPVEHQQCFSALRSVLQLSVDVRRSGRFYIVLHFATSAEDPAEECGDAGARAERSAFPLSLTAHRHQRKDSSCFGGPKNNSCIAKRCVASWKRSSPRSGRRSSSTGCRPMTFCGASIRSSA